MTKRRCTKGRDGEDCSICKDVKLFKKLSKAAPQLTNELNALWDRLEAAETDAVYWRMKYKGTWPCAETELKKKKMVKSKGR